MPDHLDAWAGRIRVKRWLWWVLTLAAISGFSASTVAGLFSLAWFWIPGAAAVLVLALIHEVTFTVWRESEWAKRAGIQVTGYGMGYATWGEEQSGRFWIETDSAGKAVRPLVVPEEPRVPRKILFEQPGKTDYIARADVPVRVKWRNRLERHSFEVTAFVEGGVVLDETHAPAGSRINFWCYFDPSEVREPKAETDHEAEP
jgi:hypothetical protein